MKISITNHNELKSNDLVVFVRNEYTQAVRIFKAGKTLEARCTPLDVFFRNDTTIVAVYRDFEEQQYINNHLLGQSAYVGTRDEFKKELLPCLVDWHQQEQSEEPLNEWIEKTLNNCLMKAIEDDLITFPRVTTRNSADCKDCEKNSGDEILCCRLNRE